METAGFLMIAQYVFVLIAIILLLASIVTPETKAGLHQVYFAISLLIVGFALITLGLLFNLGGFVGFEDWIVATWPPALVILFLIKPIKSSMKKI